MNELSATMSRHNLTGSDVARMIGCTQACVNQWRSGTRNIGKKYIQPVQHLLNRYNWYGTAGPVTVNPPVDKFSAIPQMLKDINRWLVWKPFKGKDGKTKKIPVSPSGHKKSGKDPDNWLSFEEAISRSDLIGFQFSEQDNINGIDIDNCYNTTDSGMEPWGEDIVFVMDSYTEFSPSGTGVHIICMADLDHKGINTGDVEMYSKDRFFTMTGNHYSGHEINDCSEAYSDMYIELSTVVDQQKTTIDQKPVEKLSENTDLQGADRDTLALIKQSEHADLYEGHHSLSSHSEADLSLCNVLAFWTSKDPDQMNRLFCASGLYRDKWESARGDATYSAITIQKAIEGCSEVYNPSVGHGEPKQGIEWPDPDPIKAELEPVPLFSADMLPESIGPWVMDVAHRMCVPPDYVAVSLIVVVSSIIGTSCRIKPKRYDDWTVTPNLWGAAIGYPSDGKTPSFEDVLANSVSRLEREATDYFNNDNVEFDAEKIVAKMMLDIKKKALSKALKKGNDIDDLKAELTQDDVEPPKKRRYRTSNASVEKLGELLRDNPRGMLVYRDELVGAFNKWEKEGDRPFYLEGWSGKSSFIDDKIGRGTTDVAQVCLSILGTIQPDRIASYLIGAINGHDNDGFVQRFQLLVFPDRVKWDYVDCIPDAHAREQTYKVVHRLAHGDFSDLVDLGDFALFVFDDEAQDLFVEWFKNLHHDKIGSTDEHPVVIEHFGKYRSLMPSLALIFHLLEASRYVVDTPVDGLPSYRYHRSVNQVPPTSVGMAIAWCEFLEAHARRIYKLATNAGGRAAAILAEKIQEGKLEDKFNRRIISRKNWKLLSDDRIIDEALEILVEHWWIYPVEPDLKKSGRPMLTTYVVNPKIALKNSRCP